MAWSLSTQESRRQGEQQQQQEEGSVRTDTLHGCEAGVEVGFKAACRAAWGSGNAKRYPLSQWSWAGADISLLAGISSKMNFVACLNLCCWSISQLLQKKRQLVSSLSHDWASYIYICVCACTNTHLCMFCSFQAFYSAVPMDSAVDCRGSHLAVRQSNLAVS